jgi:lysophospholipase L1-like esterase
MKTIDSLPAHNLSDWVNSRDKLRVAAIGDSSVFGVGDSGGHLKSVGAGWAGRLAHDLACQVFVNLAQNGARARHLEKNQLPAAVAFDANLALLCIGTNDILRNDFSPQEIRSHLGNLAAELTRNRCALVILGLPNPIVSAPGPLMLRKILSRRAEKVNAVLQEISKLPGVFYVDAWQSKMVQEKEFWHVDRMHPSPLGHQKIANHIKQTLNLKQVSPVEKRIESPSSQFYKVFWLLTNGSKWFFKRSFDLLPAILWLLIGELFRRMTRRKFMTE